MITKYNEYDLNKTNMDEEELYCYFATTECKLTKEEAIHELNYLKNLPYCSGMMKNIINKILNNDSLLEKFSICEDGSFRNITICDRETFNYIDVFVSLADKHYNVIQDFHRTKINISDLMKILELAEVIYINCCNHSKVDKYLVKNLK